MTADMTAVDTGKSTQAEGDLLQLVSFKVGAEEYAIPILAVQEINRMLPITRVPQSPPFVEGVINLRGKILPVVDLRRRFTLEVGKPTGHERIIVVEVASEKGTRVIGFTVDRVNEVLRIGRDIVDAAPAMASGSDADYVQGVGKLEDRLLILLDLNRLFGEQELAAVDRVDTAELAAAA